MAILNVNKAKNKKKIIGNDAKLYKAIRKDNENKKSITFK